MWKHTHSPESMCVTGQKAADSETYTLDRNWQSGLVRQDALWKTGTAVGQMVTSAVVDPACKTLVMYRAFSNADKHGGRWSHGGILLIIFRPTCCVSNVCLFSASVQYRDLLEVTFFPKEVHMFTVWSSKVMALVDLEESSASWLISDPLTWAFLPASRSSSARQCWSSASSSALSLWLLSYSPCSSTSSPFSPSH